MYLCCCVLVGDPTVFSGAGLRERGEVEWVRGEWREVSAVVVAPGFVEDVVIDRGFEAAVCVCEGLECACACGEDEEVAFPCWMAE